MSEELEALLVERKAVKYWRTEYLRVQRERDEAQEAVRALIPDAYQGALDQVREGNEVLRPFVEAHTEALRAYAAKLPQREGDYL